jgi:hypothetical protein
MELVTCHASVAYNFEVTIHFLRISEPLLCTYSFFEADCTDICLRDW